MELKPGYKRTEVGVIPKEWAVKTFRQVCWVNQGLQIAINRRLKKPTPTAKPYITIQSLTDRKSVEYIDNYFSSSTNCTMDDVLMTRTGNTGVVVSGVEGVFHNNFFKINFDKRILSRQFLISFLCLSSTQKIILTKAGASTIPDLNHEDFYSISVPVPPLAEQHAIAEALTDADTLLARLDALIAKKRDLKQAAMQQLLTGQTRLPGFSGEWEVKRLGEIVKTPVTDGPHITPRFLDDGIPFLSVNNLVDNKINLSDLRFISATDHQAFSRKCKPCKGDVLFGKAASVGKVAMVDFDIEFNIWSPIALIRPNSESSARFIYYQLQSPDLIGQIALLTNSSSQGNIGMGDIEKLIFKLPWKAEQTAIATVLTDMDTEIATLEARRDKTRALKQGMMQELLTGRIRLV